MIYVVLALAPLVLRTLNDGVGFLSEFLKESAAAKGFFGERGASNCSCDVKGRRLVC